MDWLAQLNATLANRDARLDASIDAQDSVFVVGAPRSGTTLVSQLMCAAFDVGYVSNLMACFWQAPVYGALLAQKLLTSKVVTSSSSYGQTQSISDPHEFGGFWRSRLGYAGMEQRPPSADIDWTDLADTLDMISRVFGRPVVYKVFQLAWHIEEFQKVRPGTRWVWVQRDIVDNAQSLLGLREHLHNDRHQWASSRPLSANEQAFDSYYGEVVFQVMAVNDWIGRALSALLPEHVLHVTYESVADDPMAFIKQAGTRFSLGPIDNEVTTLVDSVKTYPRKSRDPQDSPHLERAVALFQDKFLHQV